MAGHRIERVNEQLKREIAEILLAEVRDPRVGTATVTGVRTAPDLTLAQVRILAQGSQDEQAETLEGLQAAAPFIRVALGKRLELRRIPELRFEPDRSLEHAMRIERILSEVLPDDPEPPDGPEDPADGTPEGEGG